MEAIQAKTSVSESAYQFTVGGVIKDFDRVTHVLGETISSAGLLRHYGKLGTEEAERYNQEKADIGTGTHVLIDRYVKKVDMDVDGYTDYVKGKPVWKPILPESRRRFRFFLDWESLHKVQYLNVERTVRSEFLMVAGTMDLHMIVDGVEGLWDTKTGRLRRDAAVQIPTYWLLKVEQEAREAGDEKTLELFGQFYNALQAPPIKWPMLRVMHIEADGLECLEIDPSIIDRLAQDFLLRHRCFTTHREIKPFRRIWPERQERWLRAM